MQWPNSYPENHCSVGDGGGWGINTFRSVLNTEDRRSASNKEGCESVLNARAVCPLRKRDVGPL